MSTKVRQAIEQLRDALAECDPACADARTTRRMVADFAEARNLSDAGLTIWSGRLDELGAHHASYRSAAHHLAKVSGGTNKTLRSGCHLSIRRNADERPSRWRRHDEVQCRRPAVRG